MSEFEESRGDGERRFGNRSSGRGFGNRGGGFGGGGGRRFGNRSSGRGFGGGGGRSFGGGGRSFGNRGGGFGGGGGRRFGGSSGGGFGRPRFDGPREMHKTICTECKKECEVPFKPTEGKPVYCKDCYAKHKQF